MDSLKKVPRTPTSAMSSGRSGAISGRGGVPGSSGSENDSVRLETCEKLRQLVRSALAKHQVDTAAYFADKLVTLSHAEPDDVFLLADSYFRGKKYDRAVKLLDRHGLTSSAVPEDLRYRHLAAQCLAETKQWSDVLGMLEEVLDCGWAEDASATTPPGPPLSEAVSMELLSCACLIRGKALIELDNYAAAILWLRRALVCDIYNAEAFNTLVERHLLSSVEEEALMAGLPTSDADSFVIELYSSRLNRYDVSASVPAKFEALESKFGMAENADVAAAKAEATYYQHDVVTASRMTTRIRLLDPHNSQSTAVHVASLTAIGDTKGLFRTAHQLVDEAPESATSWFAVGCYYFAVQRYNCARGYFNKATSLDPRFAPAWLGIGHASAAQEESDQAMAAYRTATRLFPGCHMPLVCMGTVCLRTNNLSLADRYLVQARDVCPSDPLVYNELGVMHYRCEMYKDAVELFSFVLNLTRDTPQHLMKPWEPTMFNLGHAYRKLGDYKNAIQMYELCLSLIPDRASTLSALGFAWHLDGDLDKAIEYYHMALGTAPDDAFSQQMLRVALNETFLRGFDDVFAGISLNDSEPTKRHRGPPSPQRVEAPSASPHSSAYVTPESFPPTNRSFEDLSGISVDLSMQSRSMEDSRLDSSVDEQTPSSP